MPRLRLDRFRLGQYALVVTFDDSGLHYRYDPARPESVLALSQVDDALQTALGRTNPVKEETTQSSEPGARYIDFLIPGLLGMNLMNSGMWGIGFAVVDMRQRKLLKRFIASPMRRTDFLLALGSSRLVLMIIEVALLLGFGVLVFHMKVEGSLLAILLVGGTGRSFIRRRWPAHRQPRAKDRKRQRADQPGDDAHVDFLRRVLLLRTLPEDRSAADQGAAADRVERCLARHHPAGREPEFAMDAIAILVLWGGLSFLLALKWFRWS